MTGLWVLRVGLGVTYTSGVMLGPLCGHRASPAQRVQSLAVVRDTWFTPRTSVVKMERHTREADPVVAIWGDFPLLVADLVPPS